MTAVKAPGVTPRRRMPVLRRPRVPQRWRKPLLVAGAVIIGFWVIVAIASPWITPDNPLAQGAQLLTAPSGHHLFGTDENGRDVLSRVIAGARVSLPLGILLVLLEPGHRGHPGCDRRVLRRVVRRDHHAHHGPGLRIPHHPAGHGGGGRARAGPVPLGHRRRRGGLADAGPGRPQPGPDDHAVGLRGREPGSSGLPRPGRSG